MLEFAELPVLVERLRSFDSIISWYGSNRPEFRDTTGRLGLPVRFLPALPTDTTINAVDFYLNGSKVMTKTRAPFDADRNDSPGSR